MSDKASGVSEPVQVSPSSDVAVRVRGLTARTHDRVLVDNVDLEIPARGVTAIVGSSGSGKTTTALALMGEHGPGVVLSTDEISTKHTRFGYVPQHPGAVLNPVLRIGAVLREVERSAHTAGSTVTIADALKKASFPADPALLRRYPHQLSGGQQQRLVIAYALLTNPTCLIMDEPTTGQDPANRSAILAEIAQLGVAGLAIVLLTHDFDAVRAVADHVIVMARGQVVEAVAADLLDASTQEQTRTLVDAAAKARHHRRTDSAARAVIPRLSLSGISAGFTRSPVLQNFSVRIDPGECVALVGPSGSGKTTAARGAAGLHSPTGGRVLLDGRPLAASIRRRDRSDLADVSYIAQDAKGAFNPYRSVWDQLVRSPIRLRGTSSEAASAQVTAALERVGLDPGITQQPPGALSGGEAQRAALARCLAAQPLVLICDEITTGLDPVAQQRILDLLTEVAQSDQVSLLVISHDSDVVRAIADSVIDMTT